MPSLLVDITHDCSKNRYRGVRRPLATFMLQGVLPCKADDTLPLIMLSLETDVV